MATSVVVGASENFAEQCIVPHAKAHEHVKVRFRLVQQQGLHDGVAKHGAFAAFERLKVKIGSPVAVDFAPDGLDVKARLAEQSR